MLDYKREEDSVDHLSISVPLGTFEKIGIDTYALVVIFLHSVQFSTACWICLVCSYRYQHGVPRGFSDW